MKKTDQEKMDLASRDLNWLQGSKEKQLFAAAKAALASAYAPYSGIRVGAGVLAGSGKVYVGCNIENSSYSLTICAERCCLHHALAHNEKAFELMVVVTDAPQVTSPCGACRQVLAEFNPYLPVVFVHPGGVERFTVEALLPHAFSLD